MEALLLTREGEEEEVMDLKTRKRSHHSQNLPTVSAISKASSTTSSITSESSDSSLEDFLGTQNHENNGTSNGHNSTIVEKKLVGSVVNEESEVEPEVKAQKEENFQPNGDGNDEDEITVDSNAVSFSPNHEGTDRIYVHPNGNTDVSQEISTNSSCSSKSPDTVLGLKDLECLLDESSNTLNLAATNVYNALEDTLNNERTIVKNENVHLSLPKDTINEAQQIDVATQKHALILNEAPKSVEVENVHLSLPKDHSIPEIEEFDVERVIQKQETHDLYCPNCNSCITKRVILKRRKRKIQDISSSEDVPRHTLSQPPTQPSSVEIVEDNVPASNVDAADEPIYAITCLSCFSFFLPTKNGLLRRIFGRKPEVPVQKDAPLTETPVSTSGGVDGEDTLFDANVDDGKGNVFPLWIVNCCQPTEKRPAKPDMPVAQEPEPGNSVIPSDNRELLKDDIKPLPTPSNGTHSFQPIMPVPFDPQPHEVPNAAEDIENKTKPQLPITNDAPFPPEPESPVKLGTHLFQPIAPLSSDSQPSELPNGKALPSETTPVSDDEFAPWFLNICQPRRDGINRPDLPGKPESSLLLLPSDHNPPIEPDQTDIPLSLEPEPHETTLADKPLPPEIKPDSGNGYALWFVNCCQPRIDGSHLSMKPDASLPIKPEPKYDDNEVQTAVRPEPGEDSLSPKPMPPIIPADDDKPLPPEPVSPRMPDEITLVPEPKPSVPLETGGNLTITMPDPVEPTPSPPTMISGDTPPETRPPDLEAPLLDSPEGSHRTQERTGVDVIKAIVYGGLLESVTSLSVVTSAAGGDATTLNIVALGLANVFGGLVVLFHSLRVLKHEHGTERYIQQLGRPGHFFLHATVAVISYVIFGLMAPIIYGFTFRKSDIKEYKIITLAAAYFVCITVLSTAKSYVRSPPKAYMQTIFYYLSLGFAVSGLGYVAGNVINMVLKKLGVFDSSSAVPEAGDMKGIWASY